MTPREIYDAHIAPLITQLDAIAQQHGFSYFVAVQYAPGDLATSYILSDKTDTHLLIAAEVITSSAVWENEKTEKHFYGAAYDAEIREDEPN
jgi:hypothetical protein